MTAQEEYDLLRKVCEIVNEYTSKTTGWPRHRIIETKKGSRSWRMSKERHDAWFRKKFILPDLMRPHIHFEEFKDDGLVSYEEYYKDFYRSEFGFTMAVRKDFAIKVLALGYVS
jgi:hypothetical protein